MRYFVILLFVNVPLITFSQFSFGVKGGLNINDIVAKDLPKNFDYGGHSNVGFHLGTYGMLRLGNNFTFNPELQFSQRGININDARINLNYVELPVLISYFPIKWLSVNIGPNAGYLISAIARGNGKRDLSEGYNKFDLGLSGGVGVNLSEKISLVGRYYYGMFSIDEIVYTLGPNSPSLLTSVKEYNRNAQFSLCFKLK